MNYKLLIIKFLFLLLSIPAFAQQTTNEAIGMADILRQSGKIYVVVSILVLILAGVFLCLWLLEKRIKRIEKYIAR